MALTFSDFDVLHLSIRTSVILQSLDAMVGRLASVEPKTMVRWIFLFGKTCRHITLIS
jgi:hypothetical protein